MIPAFPVFREVAGWATRARHENVGATGTAGQERGQPYPRVVERTWKRADKAVRAPLRRRMTGSFSCTGKM